MDSTTRSLRVTCSTQTYVPLDELHGIQGNLKAMSVEAYEKFRRLVLKDGINFAMHVWKELDGTKKKPLVKWWIIDGHGRAQLFRKLREEGYEIPPLPVVEIEAVSYRDAKKKVLGASSSFNTMTKDGLYEFMSDLEMGFDDLEEYVLPEIDLPEFKMEYFEEPAEEVSEAEPQKEQVTFDAYKNAQVKQVTLYFAATEYEQLLKSLDALVEKFQVEDYSQVVWRLASEAVRS